ncbi:unnamed protein product [Protopolystoma xenopodis]|uniref:Uncharacterized protein n=1 Tax=Protopolystoma xenopodis TaxID=117903 RepID=A0A448WFA3_9PLAT|nr:unnamed protein product [Protopolystoma xenopodis]
MSGETVEEVQGSDPHSTEVEEDSVILSGRAKCQHSSGQYEAIFFTSPSAIRMTTSDGSPFEATINTVRFPDSPSQETLSFAQMPPFQPALLNGQLRPSDPTASQTPTPSSARPRPTSRKVLQSATKRVLVPAVGSGQTSQNPA